jgi:uncharacterized membrane protein YphA (DoxX/SURF4 family)
MNTVEYMKIQILISRILLGLIFALFGLNGFLHFIPAPPPTGTAGQFFGALFVSHYYVVVFGLQFIAGVLLLANRFVPLALTILAPILVNIVLFHAFMAPQGYAAALIAIALWGVLFYRERAAFAALFSSRGAS